MKNSAQKVGRYLLIFCVIYPFGLFLFFLFKGLRRIRLMKIKHWDRFPHGEERLVVVANHPSIIDPMVLPSLFFWGFLQRPIKHGPMLVADANNFYNSWWFFWLRPFLICVKRGDKDSENAAFYRMSEALKSGRTVILFGEGGRTFKGKPEEMKYSKTGKKIRTLKNSVGLLVRKTKAKVLPVWVEGTERFFGNTHDRLFSWKVRWNPFCLIVGRIRHFQPTDSKRYDAEEITAEVEQALLQLADEA